LLGCQRRPGRVDDSVSRVGGICGPFVDGSVRACRQERVNGDLFDLRNDERIDLVAGRKPLGQTNGRVDGFAGRDSIGVIGVKDKERLDAARASRRVGQHGANWKLLQIEADFSDSHRPSLRESHRQAASEPRNVGLFPRLRIPVWLGRCRQNPALKSSSWESISAGKRLVYGRFETVGGHCIRGLGRMDRPEGFPAGRCGLFSNWIKAMALWTGQRSSADFTSPSCQSSRRSGSFSSPSSKLTRIREMSQPSISAGLSPARWPRD